jgi:hypothetical protein
MVKSRNRNSGEENTMENQEKQHKRQILTGNAELLLQAQQHVEDHRITQDRHRRRRQGGRGLPP